MAITFNSTTPVAPAGSVNLTWQKDMSGNVSGYIGPGSPQVFTVFLPGVGSNSQVCFYAKLAQAVTFPSGAASSNATAKTAATGSTTYTFSKNGTPFATAVFAGSGTTATFTQASDAVFAAGDILEIDGPSTADATLANIGLVLYGLRT